MLIQKSIIGGRLCPCHKTPLTRNIPRDIRLWSTNQKTVLLREFIFLCSSHMKLVACGAIFRLAIFLELRCHYRASHLNDNELRECYYMASIVGKAAVNTLSMIHGEQKVVAG